MAQATLGSLVTAAKWFNNHIPHADWQTKPRPRDDSPTRITAAKSKQSQEDTRQLLIDADRVIAGKKPRYMTPELESLAKSGISERSFLLLMEAARNEAKAKRLSDQFFPERTKAQSSLLAKALAGGK